MIRVLVIAAAVLAFTSALAAQTDVLAAQRQWDSANAAYDASKLEQLMTGDALVIDMTGRARNKSEYLSAIRSAKPENKAARAKATLKLEDVKLRQYGDAAIVTRLSRNSATGAEARSSYTWVREGDQWRLSTFQVTRAGAARSSDTEKK